MGPQRIRCRQRAQRSLPAAEPKHAGARRIRVRSALDPGAESGARRIRVRAGGGWCRIRRSCVTDRNLRFPRRLRFRQSGGAGGGRCRIRRAVPPRWIRRAGSAAQIRVRTDPAPILPAPARCRSAQDPAPGRARSGAGSNDFTFFSQFFSIFLKSVRNRFPQFF